MISPLAHISPNVKIGQNVTIHPFVTIDENVEIGDNCEIFPFVAIVSGTRIGKNTKIYSGAVIGADPQDFRWKGQPSVCHIGDNCVIREQVIINRGFDSEGGTRIGNDTFVMAGCHIGHDTVIEGRCVLGNGVTIAGGVHVDKCSILSSNVILHEGAKVGKWVLVKGGCRISGNVPPYVIMAHNPVAYFGVNAFVLKKKGFTEEQIEDIAAAYRHVYQSNTSVFNAVQRIREDIADTPIRAEILNFINGADQKIVATAVDTDAD